MSTDNKEILTGNDIYLDITMKMEQLTKISEEMAFNVKIGDMNGYKQRLVKSQIILEKMEELKSCKYVKN